MQTQLAARPCAVKSLLDDSIAREAQRIVTERLDAKGVKAARDSDLERRLNITSAIRKPDVCIDNMYKVLSDADAMIAELEAVMARYKLESHFHRGVRATSIVEMMTSAINMHAALDAYKKVATAAAASYAPNTNARRKLNHYRMQLALRTNKLIKVEEFMRNYGFY